MVHFFHFHWSSKILIKLPNPITYLTVSLLKITEEEFRQSNPAISLAITFFLHTYTEANSTQHPLYVYTNTVTLVCIGTGCLVNKKSNIMTEKWVAPKSKMIEGWTMRCLLNHTCDKNEELRNWNWKINLDAETFSINAILPELQQTQKESIKALKMYSRLTLSTMKREDKDGKTRSTLDWKGGLLDLKQFHQKE